MPETLVEREFDRLADLTLKDLVESIADLEAEGIDADLESGVLKIEFADGTRYVVNSHRAARQIWMAAEATAWHFDWDGGAWRSTRTGEELWAVVEGTAAKKLGRSIRLSARSP